MSSAIYKRRNKFLYAIRGNLQSLESIIQHLKSNPLHEQLSCPGVETEVAAAAVVSSTSVKHRLQENHSREIKKLKADIHELESMLSQLMQRYYTIEEKSNLCQCLKETCQAKKFYKKDGESIVTTLEKIEENRYEEIIEKEIQTISLVEEKKKSSEMEEEESEWEGEEDETDGEGEIPEKEKEKTKQLNKYFKQGSLSSHLDHFSSLPTNQNHFVTTNEIQKSNALRAEEMSKLIFEDIHNNRIANLFPEMFLEENKMKHNIDHSESLLQIIHSLTEEKQPKVFIFF